MANYNHGVDMNFEIHTKKSDGSDFTAAQLRAALEEKLKLSDEDLLMEANCFDSMESMPRAWVRCKMEGDAVKYWGRASWVTANGSIDPEFLVPADKAQEISLNDGEFWRMPVHMGDKPVLVSIPMDDGTKLTLDVIPFVTSEDFLYNSPADLEPSSIAEAALDYFKGIDGSYPQDLNAARKNAANAEADSEASRQALEVHQPESAEDLKDLALAL